MPNGTLHVIILEGNEVVDCLSLGRKLRNVVCLEAIDELAHVICLLLDRAEDGTIANWAIGTKEDEVVGELGGRKTKVRTRLLAPDVLKVGALVVDYRETWLEGGVEASGANEDVYGIFLTVVALATALGDLVDFAIDCLDVVFAECLEVADTGCETTASDVPVGDQFLLEVGVLKLFGHLLTEVGLSLVVDIAALEENAILTVQSALDVLAVIDQRTGLGGKFVLLVLREYVLLETLYWRNPSRLTNEGSDFLDMRLNGGKNLNARGAAEMSVRSLT